MEINSRNPKKAVCWALVRARSSKSIPSVLTIAGSDSGGGAGIQADLKTFAALGVHGLSVITAITAQNPKAILESAPCSIRIVSKQLEAVFEEFSPAAIKIGMLPTAALVKAVAAFLVQNRRDTCPIIVDPVMAATSGAALTTKKALRVLGEEIFPLATLITPNVQEAQALTGIEIHEPEDLRQAARMLQSQFGCAALVKGGHLLSAREAVDILCDGEDEWIFRSPYVRGVRTHGTGCTFSAGICAFMGLGKSLVKAIYLAKRYITHAIQESVNSDSNPVLSH